MKKKEKLGSWADDPCFYVTVRDGELYGFLVGPFRTKAEADVYGYGEKHHEMLQAAMENDPKAWFYAYGVAKAPNGYRTGVLNDRLGVVA